MKTRWIAVGLAVLIAGAVTVNAGINKSYTVTLTEADRAEKNAEIRPVFNTVKVYGDTDTEVLFTDVHTGESHLIGYITPGMSEKIRLQRGHSYTVKARGEITTCPVDVVFEIKR